MRNSILTYMNELLGNKSCNRNLGNLLPADLCSSTEFGRDAGLLPFMYKAHFANPPKAKVS